MTKGLTVAARRVHFRYLGNPNPALNGVDLDVGAGETVLLVGASGCGKSTLALCLNSLIPHEIPGDFKGEIRVGQQSTLEAPLSRLRQQVGIVFQDPETQFVMPRVNEEVAFGLENLAIPPRDMDARVDAALAVVGLAEKREAWVEILSGGQKQRLALAGILAMQPSLLVLDEPTANLDPQATDAFFRTLHALKCNSGASILLIEHQVDVALPLVDRVVALNRDGQVIAAGTPQEVYNTHATRLEQEGVWLPASFRLAGKLKAMGWPLNGCPLTLDQTAMALRPLLAQYAWATEAVGSNSSKASSSKCASAPEAIRVEGVTFNYPDGTLALRDVQLSVPQGCFFALIGANGSGKTTLAKHLVGLLRAQRGRIIILGRQMTSSTRSGINRQVGYVFQNPEHQFVAETVVDELAYSLRGRMPELEVQRRVESLLAQFGLSEYAEANPFALSQGQKRRLSVAAMVALEQPILILDEPTFGQDHQSAQALMAAVRALQAAGTTILCITHDMQLVAEYAQEVAVMHQGQVIFQGTPGQLFQHPRLLKDAGLRLPALAELSYRLDQPGLYTLDAWLSWATAFVARQRQPAAPTC